MGLSPQARGELCAGQYIWLCEGPIPAGAGGTSGLYFGGLVMRAYPRRRGGNPRPAHAAPST